MIYGFFLKIVGTGLQFIGLLAGLALAVKTGTVIGPLIATRDRKAPLDIPGTARQPRVIAAPGMLDRKPTVVREEGESDAHYQSRLELFGFLLDNAKRVVKSETARRLVIAIAAILLTAGYGYANPVQVNKGGAANQAQVYGDGSSATANRNVNRNSARSAASSRSQARATGGTGGSSAATVNVSQGASGGSYSGSARAPDVFAPGAAGMDCPTVGFGASGAGIGGGGGFGPSWLSTDCNARKLAGMLDRMGYHDQALALLRSHFPEVDKVFREASPSAPVPVAVKRTAPAFCRTPGLVLSAYPECH